MLRILKTIENQIQELTTFEEGCWIALIDPTRAEMKTVADTTAISKDMLSAALDDEERSRIEYEDQQTMILVDIPRVELEGDTYIFNTIPLGIIHTQDYIITVCLYDTPLINDFINQRVRDFYTYKKTRFIYQLLYRNSSRYLRYLRRIDKASDDLHLGLQKSYRNKELLQIMALEKSLVYFTTSLKTNEIVMEKLVKVDYIKKYADDSDLLDDVIIENKQAIEMCSIYRDILSSMMNAHASIINNNLNIVMKFLAAVTIVISVPTLITSAWGMNVPVPWTSHPLGFTIVSGIAVATAIIA